MPLLDHFHPPLSERRHGLTFLGSWATYLSSHLNGLLPDGYFAEANVQYGIEIDVATFEERGAAVLPAGWTPPPPQASVPLAVSDTVVEVGIFSRSGGPTLAGAVELVSPANKDRPAHRDALISKCAAYLQAGVGLVLVNVVTERPADLHRDLLARLGAPEPGRGPALSGVAYRPVERDGLPHWTSGTSRSPSAGRSPRSPSGSAAGCASRSTWRRRTRAPASSNGCSRRRSRPRAAP